MFGTNTTFDELAANFQTIDKIGLDNAFDAIYEAWARQDEIVREELADLVDVTTDRLRRSGSPDQTTTQELSEFGTPNPQKVLSGALIGFPLRKYGTAWQATYQYLKTATGVEMAAQARAAMTADLRRIQYQIRVAFYTPTNYTFDDFLVNHLQNIPLPVKALANADGFPIPLGPNGEVYNASTHTHYLAKAGASVAQSDYDALIDTVMEHHNTGTPVLEINRADQAFVKGFVAANGADVFAPLVDVRVHQPITSLYGNAGLDVDNVYNRMIGYYHGAEVWVKPRAISGYPICWIKGVPKPLVMRDPDFTEPGMQLEFDGISHPLMSKVWARFFGIAPWNRVNAAVLDTTHQTTYAAPAIPAA